MRSNHKIQKENLLAYDVTLNVCIIKYAFIQNQYLSILIYNIITVIQVGAIILFS